jgi:hypothetical protein
MLLFFTKFFFTGIHFIDNGTHKKSPIIKFKFKVYKNSDGLKTIAEYTISLYT